MPAGVAVIQHVLPNEHYDKGVSVNVSCTKIAVLVLFSTLNDASFFTLNGGVFA